MCLNKKGKDDGVIAGCVRVNDQYMSEQKGEVGNVHI